MTKYTHVFDVLAEEIWQHSLKAHRKTKTGIGLLSGGDLYRAHRAWNPFKDGKARAAGIDHLRVARELLRTPFFREMPYGPVVIQRKNVVTDYIDRALGELKEVVS